MFEEDWGFVSIFFGTYLEAINWSYLGHRPLLILPIKTFLNIKIKETDTVYAAGLNKAFNKRTYI